MHLKQKGKHEPPGDLDRVTDLKKNPRLIEELKDAIQQMEERKKQRRISDESSSSGVETDESSGEISGEVIAPQSTLAHLSDHDEASLKSESSWSQEASSCTEKDEPVDGIDEVIAILQPLLRDDFDVDLFKSHFKDYSCSAGNEN